MLNYSTILEEGLKMLELSEAKFYESQQTRMDYILHAKESGEKFLVIKEALKGASKLNPKTLEGLEELGSFTSFHNFCEYVHTTNGWKETTIKDHVTLAENWGIVLRLGMQDKDNARNIGNCMRVSRTLRVIRWYKRKLKEGAPAESLTLELYWREQEESESSGLSYGDLKQRVEVLEGQLAAAQAEKEGLLNEIEKLKAALNGEPAPKPIQELSLLERFKLKHRETLVSV